MTKPKRAKVHGFSATAAALDGDGEAQAQGAKHRVVAVLKRVAVLLHGGGEDGDNPQKLELHDVEALGSRTACSVLTTSELPQGVSFPSRIIPTNLGVVWRDNDADGAVYVLDLSSGEVRGVGSSPPEPIADAFVNSTGEQIAVVGKASRKLWECRRRPDGSVTEDGAKWRLVDGSAPHAEQIAGSYCGRFFSSPVLGNCFELLHVFHCPDGVVSVEKWLFDVETRWEEISYSSSELGKTAVDQFEASLTVQLCVSDEWMYAAVEVRDTLFLFQPGLDDGTVQQIPLGDCIQCATWMGNQDTLALLLSNGQLCVVDADVNKHFTQLKVETLDMMPESVTRRTSKTLQLAWAPDAKRVVVNLGSSYATFEVELVEDEESSSLFEPFTGCTSMSGMTILDTLLGSGPEVITELKGDEAQEIGDCIRKRLESTAAPSADELLDFSRIALVRSYNIFEDLYFMLLCIVHRQLVDEPSSFEENEQNSFMNTAKELKLIEVLLSLTISMQSSELRQIGSRMLAETSVCSTKSERREYYRAEIDKISRCVKSKLDDDDGGERSWVESPEVEAFAQVYLSRISILLRDIAGDFRNEYTPAEVLERPVALCRDIVDKRWEEVSLEVEGAAARIPADSTGKNRENSAVDELVLLIASYTMACRNLHIGGVVFDLEHLLAVSALGVDFVRKEYLCCFLQPWSTEFGDNDDTSETSNATSSWSLESAVKLAEKAGVLQLFTEFCIASGSPSTHMCLQAVCTSAKTTWNTSSTDTHGGAQASYDIHLQVCEAYAGEILAIMQQLRVVPEFLYCIREAQAQAALPSRIFPAKSGFDVFCARISAENNEGESDSDDSGRKELLWELCGYENRLRDRICRLLSRITWHVKRVGPTFPGLYKRAFVADLFTSDLRSVNLDKVVREFVIKAYSIHATGSSMQEVLNRLQSQDPAGGGARHGDGVSSFRWDKVLRILVMVEWCLWLRERAAYCLRRISLAKHERVQLGQEADKVNTIADGDLEEIGALSATCSLQLNALGVIYAGNDLFPVQISLLEGAAKLNAEKTAVVICWGFPAEKIPTRHLKRYKALRRELKKQFRLTMPPLEILEQQSQFLQKHGHRKARELVHGGALDREIEGATKRSVEPKRGSSADITVLIDCCSNIDFQRLVSIAAGINPSKPLTHADTIFVQGQSTSQYGLKRHPSLSQKLVSRDEVIAMLQEQTQQLEEKIRLLTPTLTASKNVPEQGIKGQPMEHAQFPERKTFVRAESNPPGLKHLAIRDLDVRRRSHGSSVDKTEARSRKNKAQKPTTRHHDSVRNALKLFHLRQETGECQHHQDVARLEPLKSRSLPTSKYIVTKPCSQSQDDGPATMGEKAPDSDKRQQQTPALPKKESVTHRRRCKIQEGPSVYPLRFEYGFDGASLKLLGRRSPGRPKPSVRSKQFVFGESQRLSLNRQEQASQSTSHPAPVSPEIVALKTSSAQTSTTDDATTVAAKVAPSTIEPPCETGVSIDRKEEYVVPENLDAREQRERKLTAPSGKDGFKSPLCKAIAIQCHVEEEIRSKSGRRKRGPPPLEIPDRFPIWVDIDSTVGRAKSKERRQFLQVVRFADRNGERDSSRTVRGEVVAEAHSIELVPAQSVPSSASARSEYTSEAIQLDDSHPEQTVHASHDEDHAAEKDEDAIRAKHQARYRRNFPASEPSSTGETDDAASGLGSLIGLRENMKRMTERLRALETCADTIDEEFRDSHKRLESIGNTQHACVSSKVRALEGIDEILEITSGDIAPELGQQSEAKKPKASVLAKQASSDMAAAKKLLEIIEQLTIEGANEV